MIRPVAPAIEKIFDIGIGRYDVSVSVGPSYQSKRQEAVASILELIRVFPQAMGICGDILLRNMDWPMHNEIADRLKRTLPPELQDGDESDPQTLLAKTQSQLNAIMQQHQQLTQTVTKQNEIINTKQVEANAKLAIAKLEMQTKLAVAEIQAKAQNIQERTRMFLEMWQELHGSAHEAGMEAAQQAHDRVMARLNQQGNNTPQGEEGNEEASAVPAGATTGS